MNRLILITLLILSPYTILQSKMHRMKPPIRRHTTKRYIPRERNNLKTAICNPKTINTAITAGSTVFVAILKVTTIILTLLLH